MLFKSLAQLKRHCTVGTTLTMVQHDWFPTGELLGLPRKIKRVQGNAIQFEPQAEGKQGSWLYWPSAKNVCFIENGFRVDLNKTENAQTGEVMIYQFSQSGN